MKRYYNRGIIKNTYKEITHSPHATTVLKRVGPALQRPPEMAMHLMPPSPTLIHEGQFEERSHIGSLARKRNKQRDVGSIVLDALAIRVKVDRPRIPSHIKRIGGYVLSNPKPLRQRIARDLELVRTIYGLGDRRRCGGRRGRRGRA